MAPRAGQVLGQGMRRISRLVNGNDETAIGAYLGLFVNNVTPDYSDTNATYTECTDSGYGRNPVIGSWIEGGVTSPPFTTYRGPDYWTFAGGSGETVYGYFCIDTSEDIILWACLLPTPYVIDLNPAAGLGITSYWNWFPEAPF